MEFDVTDYPRGHPDGRDDRDVRVLTVRLGEETLAEVRFSANWNPRGFRLKPDPTGEHSAVLEYEVGHGPLTSCSSQCIDFDCAPRTENAARNILDER